MELTFQETLIRIPKKQNCVKGLWTVFPISSITLDAVDSRNCKFHIPKAKLTSYLLSVLWYMYTHVCIYFFLNAKEMLNSKWRSIFELAQDSPITRQKWRCFGGKQARLKSWLLLLPVSYLTIGKLLWDSVPSVLQREIT